MYEGVGEEGVSAGAVVVAFIVLVQVLEGYMAQIQVELGITPQRNLNHYLFGGGGEAGGDGRTRRNGNRRRRGRRGNTPRR